MRRFFMSTHPTFGSYEHPDKSKIEKSPYFFWWLALTHNKEYLKFCANQEVTTSSLTDGKFLKVYKDFGDVRYTGDKHRAFTKWWCEKINDHETRGTYLFAEPQLNCKVKILDNEKDTSVALRDPNLILVQIPKNLNRRQIDKEINAIFKNELSFTKGRVARSPKSSSARYHLSKPVQIANLKTAFKIIEAEQNAALQNSKLSNIQLANKAGVKVNLSNKTKMDQSDLAAYELYLLSTTISRKKAFAKSAIANAALGIFP